MVDPLQANSDEAKRRRYLRRWLELEAEYSTWRPTHEDIISFIQPKRGRFLLETNKGNREDGDIVDGYAGDAARKLGAAMDTGITSEAREWFTLGPEDPRLAERDGVREYCHTAQAILFALIARSNFYPANRNLLLDLIGPAIGLMLIEEDPVEVFRCTHVPIGQFRVVADSKGRVNLVVRKFQFTAAQMVGEFGEEKVSPACRNAMSNDTTQSSKFMVLHIIEERTSRAYGKIDAKNKPWSSCWLEVGMGTWTATVLGNGEINDPTGPSGLLRESGYDEQPFICPRWNALGQDAYGQESPGWNALPDTKELQAVKIGGATAFAKMLDPPMNRPSELANASQLPGAENDIPANSRVKYEPAVIIPPTAVTVAREEKIDIRQAIDRSFYGDVLFLLSQDDRLAKATAELVRGKKEERLLQLGGVYARYADEALKQAISRFFAMAQRAGRMPRPPPELVRSGSIRVNFQNPLVTAQKTIQYTGMQQLISLGIAVAQARAAGADKLDGDEIMDSGADMLGVKPNLLKSDDVLAQERQQAAAQAKAKAVGEAMTQAAPAIKDLSSTDPEKLRQLTQMLGPAAAAQATA